jgi:hypothetical protein
MLSAVNDSLGDQDRNGGEIGGRQWVIYRPVQNSDCRLRGVFDGRRHAAKCLRLSGALVAHPRVSQAALR